MRHVYKTTTTDHEFDCISIRYFSNRQKATEELNQLGYKVTDKSLFNTRFKNDFLKSTALLEKLEVE